MSRLLGKTLSDAKETEMGDEGMVMRSIVIDRDVDETVLEHAKCFHGRKGAAFRLFVETGLAQYKAGAALPARVDGAQTLRMCYWDTLVAERVKALAFQERIPENELISRLARLGMTKVRGLTSNKPAR